MTVWIDTTTLNACDSGTFLLRVWAGTPTESGMQIGFGPEDSLYLFRFVLWWDRSKFDIDPVLQLPGNGIPSYLASRARDRPVTKDPKEGILYIEAGNIDLKPLVGQNMPLVVFKARVTAGDTFSGLDGWAEVRPIEEMFEGAKPYGPVTRHFGFVHVVKDTTPAYTGRIDVTDALFDSLRTDTVTVTTENLGNRKVKEIAFALRADTSYYAFRDTVRLGTLSDGPGWSEIETYVAADSIYGRFVRTDDLLTDGPLLRIVLERRTDSSFSRPLQVTSFGVNPESCLGKFESTGAEIVAKAVGEEPVDTVTTSVPRDEKERREDVVTVIPGISGSKVTVLSREMDVKRVELYDGMGRRVPLASVRPAGEHEVVVVPAENLPNGTYFVVVHGHEEVIQKQFSVIK